MLKFDQHPLMPAVIQDDSTGAVLMVAFMNEEALRLTRETGYTHFFSLSRNELWRKGEQSGNVQEVRAIFVNCEESSLLIRVVQHGGAACHNGYHSCYYRRLLPDNTYQTVEEQVFDPEVVYQSTQTTTPSNEKQIPIVNDYDEIAQTLEEDLRQLYSVYTSLREKGHDLSRTSRLLQEGNRPLLLARLADELQELIDVQRGEHVHTNRQDDTILEGSQVGYWLCLLAVTESLSYDDFLPHSAILHGYSAAYDEKAIIEQKHECLQAFSTDTPMAAIRGLTLGFALVGWVCAQAHVSPLAPTKFDMEQMRRKGLLQ